MHDKLAALLMGVMVYVIAMTAGAQTSKGSETNDFALRRGFVSSTGFATAPWDGFNYFTPEIAIGFKAERVIATVGLLVSVATGETTFTPFAFNATTQHRDSTDGIFMVRPDVQVTFVQWPQSSVELFGQFAAAFGSAPTLIELYVAPGLRGWAHRNFAVGGSLGAEYALGARAYPISPRLEFQFLAVL